MLDSEPLCRHCYKMGLIRPADVVDHILPRGTPGSTEELSNLRPLCFSCHNRVTAKYDGGFGHKKKPGKEKD